MSRLRQEVLRLIRICKSFEQVAVLQSVSLSVAAGEFMALMGRNGVGKSALLRVIAGQEAPDSGIICFDGYKTHGYHVKQAHAAGIYLIDNQIELVPEFTVAENLFLDMSWQAGKIQYSKRQCMQRAKKLLTELEMTLDPRWQAQQLGYFECMQLVVLRAYASGVKLLIMDEPFSMLDEKEQQELEALLLRLKAKGVAFLVTFHATEHLCALADRICMLSHGTIVDERACFAQPETLHAWSQALLWEADMPHKPVHIQRRAAGSTVRFRVSDFRIQGWRQAISFELYQNEILGLYLTDANVIESAVLDAIFGLEPCEGCFFMDGHEIRLGTSARAVKHRIGYAVDREMFSNLFPKLTVRENVTMACLSRLFPYKFTCARLEKFKLREWSRFLDVDIATQASHLNRGLEKQIELTRWFCFQHKLLMLYEPARSLDSVNRDKLHQEILRQVECGCSVLLQSSSTSLLAALCDRVLVISAGQVQDILEKDAITQHRLKTY